jgi:hypothetical protein
MKHSVKLNKSLKKDEPIRNEANERKWKDLNKEPITFQLIKDLCDQDK